MEEIWKDISGYEGYYQASTEGRIRSVDREILWKDGKQNRIFKGKIKTQRVKKSTGRYIINLSKDSKKKTIDVAKTVYETFNDSKFSNLVICHNDGNVKNNKLENLREDTQKSNMLDKIIHGTINRGISHGMSKLTEEDIYNIRKDDRTNEKIALQYMVRPNHISRIKNKTRWSHL